MTTEVTAKALSQAVETARVYSFGTLIPPMNDKIPPDRVRGFVPPPPTQWVIQTDEFSSGFRERFETIGQGETKLLVAATGIGKTTTMPMQFCGFTGKSGIVILPDRLFVTMNVPWIRQNSPSVGIDTLRSKHVENPPVRSMVYYLNGEDFLSRFLNTPDLLQRLNIDFIYLDEAHLKTPSYVFILILAGLDYFKGAKVFLGTATSDGTSMILTNKFGSQQPIPFSPNEFDIDNPSQTDFRSPMHFSNMTGRVLLFLPCDKTIDLWQEYYDSADIKTLVFHTYDSHQVLFEHSQAIKSLKSFVLLSWARPETSVTLAIDKVICSGYTQEFRVVYEEKTARMVRRTVTQAERTQRMGRVNRFMPGTGFYSDVKVHPQTEQLTMTNALYVYFWSRMYNVEIKNPDIKVFDQTFSGCDNQLISLLLTSKVHPILMFSYLSERGWLYSGWEQMRYIFHTPVIRVEDQDVHCETSHWTLANTGAQEWLEEPLAFRTNFVFPNEWQVIPAIAWLAKLGEGIRLQIPSDDASVVGGIEPILRKPTVKETKPRKELKSALASDSFSVVHGSSIRPMSVATGFGQTPRIDFGVLPPLPEIPANFSQVSLPTRSKIHRRVTSSNSTSTVEVPRTDQWVEEMSKKQVKHRQRKSSSSSSSDRTDLQLKQVDPRNYANFKFYPMDERLTKQYLTAEPAGSTDFANFNKLVKLTVVFQNLHREHTMNKQRQDEYFLSVVRIHNYFLTKKFQVAAYMIEEKPSLLSKLLSKPAVSGYSIELEQSVKLLYAMHLDSYFVGIDKRSQHSSLSTEISVRETDTLQKMRLMAYFFLQMTNQRFCDDIERLQKAITPIVCNDRVKGTSWTFSNFILSPLHVYQDNDLEFSIPSYVDEMNDVVIVRTACSGSFSLESRSPVEGEQIVFVGFDPTFHKETTYGPALVSKIADVWISDRRLAPGLSGSLLVATADSKVVGMYLGPFELVNFDEYSYFVEMSNVTAML